MSLDLREQDPNSARFNAIAQAVLIALVGCIVGFVAAGLLVGMNGPTGWLIVAAGASAGLVPIAQWMRDQRAPDHLDLFDIDESLRPLLVRAAAAADRIQRSAFAAPAGPIAGLLDENHCSALAHVRILEADARRSGAQRRSEMLRICHQLDELADISEDLLRTSLQSQPTVLNTLIERTSLVNETLSGIDLTDEGRSTTSTEASGEPDREDRDATNGR